MRPPTPSLSQRPAAMEGGEGKLAALEEESREKFKFVKGLEC